MLYLKDEREARLFKITEIKGIKVERAFKIILKKYDNVVFWRTYNIENCQMIEYVIKLLNKILVVGKQDYQSLREYK